MITGNIVSEAGGIYIRGSYVADVKSLLGYGPILEQKAFLKSFVRSIEVSKPKVTVSYTLPMPMPIPNTSAKYSEP